MSEEIKTLQNAHSVIIDTLIRVKFLGIMSKEGQEKLMTAKNYLLEHLKMEDEILYPVLKNATEKDEGLKQTLGMMIEDMKGVSKEVFQFFEKYSQKTFEEPEKKQKKSLLKLFSPSNKERTIDKEFAEDFERIFSIIVERVQKEEDILFPEYEKYHQ